VVRTRLSRLTVTEPGVAGFNTPPVQQGAQQASQTNLKTLVGAAKAAPNKTGIYAVEWAPSQSAGLAIFAYLLPSATEAASVLQENRSGQMGVSSFAADNLTRRATYTVAGIPGSAGAQYGPAKKGGTGTPLDVAAFEHGRVVAVVEAETPSATQAHTETAAAREYAHLEQVEPGFTLSVVHYPVGPTILWAIGTALLALLVGLGPVARRRRKDRQQRRLEDELSRTVVVGGHAITKHRR
jgi:hypothetical protein